jgi:hypothetical protein
LKLTALKRSYLFNRVCYKIKLPQKYIFPLFTIYLLQPAGFHIINTTLTKIRRDHSGKQLINALKYLVDNNYINKDVNKKYSLTDTGLSLLKDIENRLRKERHDK